MILINLLPHRELARQESQRQFKMSMVAAILVGALVAVLAYTALQYQISTQESRNTFLRDRVVELDKQIKEVANLSDEITALRARQDAVESLQVDRNVPVHLLNEAVSQLPDGLYLTSLKQQGKNILIEGMAQSNERVSELLHNLARGGQWASQPELLEIVSTNVAIGAREQRRAYKFTMRFQLARPAGTAAPDATAGTSAQPPA